MAGKFGALRDNESNPYSSFGGLRWETTPEGVKINATKHPYSLCHVDPLKKPSLTSNPDPVSALCDRLNSTLRYNNQAFLTTLHTMTVFGSGGSTLSRQENTLLRIAIFTLLKTDGGTDPSYLNEKIQENYGSQDDPVGAFRTDLIGWMEKQRQSQER